jgi:hypothetical protein
VLKPCSKSSCSWEWHDWHALGAFRAVSMLQFAFCDGYESLFQHYIFFEYGRRDVCLRH